MKASSDVMDRIGRLADKADNFAHAGTLPLPARVHAEALRLGMEDIREELRAIFTDVTGENPWSE